MSVITCISFYHDTTLRTANIYNTAYRSVLVVNTYPPIYIHIHKHTRIQTGPAVFIDISCFSQSSPGTELSVQDASRIIGLQAAVTSPPTVAVARPAGCLFDLLMET